MLYTQTNYVILHNSLSPTRRLGVGGRLYTLPLQCVILRARPITEPAALQSSRVSLNTLSKEYTGDCPANTELGTTALEWSEGSDDYNKDEDEGPSWKSFILVTHSTDATLPDSRRHLCHADGAVESRGGGGGST